MNNHSSHPLFKLYSSIWRSQGNTLHNTEELSLLDYIICSLLGSGILSPFHFRGMAMLFQETRYNREKKYTFDSKEEQEGFLLFLCSLYIHLEMGSVQVVGSDIQTHLLKNLERSSLLLQNQSLNDLEDTSNSESTENRPFLLDIVQATSSEIVPDHLNSCLTRFFKGYQENRFNSCILHHSEYESYIHSLGLTQNWKDLEDSGSREYKEHLKAPEQTTPPIIGHPNQTFYFQKFHRSTKILSHYLRKRFTYSNQEPAKKITKSFVLQIDSTLAPEQIQAVQKACSSPFTIITGGPGTGKTTVVASILKTFLQIHKKEWREETSLPILLGAPTGRAAARLKESILEKWNSEQPTAPSTKPFNKDDSLFSLLHQISSSTLHRLLKYRPSNRSFLHSKHFPLQAKLICIDEVSMIDMELFSQFLQAVPPNCTLVLIGDRHQLPSVQPGAVLGDLTGFANSKSNDAKESLHKHIVELKTCHRSDKQIVELSQLIQSGDSTRALNSIQKVDLSQLSTEWNALPGCTLFPIQESKLVESMKTYFHTWATHYYLNPILPLFQKVEKETQHLFPQVTQVFQTDISLENYSLLYNSLYELFQLFRRTRCLCVLREGPRGIQTINQIVAHHLRSHFEGKRIPISNHYFSGMPITLQKNHHSLNLYNGDTGLVVAVQGTPTICFFQEQTQELPKRFVFYPISHFSHYEPAYATTVHKAQGSEYEHISLVLARKEHPLLTREVLYTGLTRAKHSVHLLGSSEEITQGTNNHINRQSGVLGD